MTFFLRGLFVASIEENKLFLFLQYVGHALAIQYSADIRLVCGREQFMDAPAGCEIVAHLICSQLEADPTLIIGK